MHKYQHLYQPGVLHESPHLNSRREYLIAGVKQPGLRTPAASLPGRYGVYLRMRSSISATRS
ncbi:MAG: hypothetical protein ACTHPD_15210, partial [Rhizomicrobium sp.]